MGCERCGAPLAAGDLFCGDCGAPVGGCPTCGEPLTPGKRFCRRCGAALALIRARLRAAGAADDAAAAASFAAAIKSLREQSTPYHLAHGLLDHAEYLLSAADAQAASAAIDEARDLAGRLRCQPLLDRADALSLTLTSQDSPHAAR